MNRLKYLNLIMVVPERRILLRRSLGGARPNVQWSCTVERFLERSEEVMVEAWKLLYEVFRIKPSIEDDRDVSVTRLHPVVSISGRFVVPVLVWPRIHLNFPAHPKDEFYAESFEDLLDDIMVNSMYPPTGHFAKHTANCIHVARALHERKVFG